MTEAGHTEIQTLPLWMAGGLAKGIHMLSKQVGDLAEWTRSSFNP